MERARQQGLRVGFAIEPAYAFVDSDGRVTGESPAVLRHAAEQLGIERLQWFPLSFHELIPALLSGRIDVIAAGLFVTAERRQSVAFSHPTACVRPALVARRGEFVRSGQQPVDTACEHCRIAVIRRSVEQHAFSERSALNREFLVVPDMATGTAAVLNGNADVFAISAPTARWIAQSDPELVVSTRGLPAEVAEAAEGCPALAFRQQDAELVEAFDSVLLDFVGSPEHVRLVAPFGLTREELPCGEAAGPLRQGCRRKELGEYR